MSYFCAGENHTPPPPPHRMSAIDVCADAGRQRRGANRSPNRGAKLGAFGRAPGVTQVAWVSPERSLTSAERLPTRRRAVTTDEWRMTNDEWRMTNDEWQMGDDGLGANWWRSDGLMTAKCHLSTRHLSPRQGDFPGYRVFLGEMIRDVSCFFRHVSEWHGFSAVGNVTVRGSLIKKYPVTAEVPRGMSKMYVGGVNDVTDDLAIAHRNVCCLPWL